MGSGVGHHDYTVVSAVVHLKDPPFKSESKQLLTQQISCLRVRGRFWCLKGVMISILAGAFEKQSIGALGSFGLASLQKWLRKASPQWFGFTRDDPAEDQTRQSLLTGPTPQ